MARIDPAARVRNHIGEILREGPVDFDHLVDELVARELQLGPDPEDRVDQVIASMPTVEFASPPDTGDGTEHDLTDLAFDRVALLDGLTWTVPVSALDVASDTIHSRALGLLFIPLLQEWCHFEGGGSVDGDSDERRTAALMGDPDLAEDPDRSRIDNVTVPAGWLAAHGARGGGFIEMRLDGDTVVGSGVDEAAKATPEMIAALRDIIDPDAPEPESLFVHDLLFRVLVHHPELRGATLPPLDELFAAAGLERDSLWIAPAGFDFAADRLGRLVEDTADVYGFDGPQTAAFRALELAWRKFQADEIRDPEDLADAGRALGDRLVVAAFSDNVLIDSDATGTAGQLLAFALGLRDVTASKRRTGAAAAWLVAQIHAHVGRTDQFEHWVEIAHREDPDHPGAVHDLAWFAFDRGEARTARTQLASLATDAVAHDLAILDTVLAPHAPKARRNDPCPCGSGRKYKHCHLGVDEVGLDDRLTWLYRKANWWLGFKHRYEAEEMAWIRGRHSDLSPEQLLDRDPLIVDAVLVEGGRFAEWLSERGALLPTDEAMLAQAWALIGHSVFQVTDVRRGAGVTVRDVRTGDVIDVDERAGSRDLRAGGYILTRALPTGTGRHQFFGGITLVPDASLDRFLDVLDAEPTPVDVLSLVATTEAPPSVSNREGEAMVFCETTWQLSEPDQAAAILDANFEATVPPGEWTWLAPIDDDPDPAASTDGGRTVRGTLRIEADRLVTSTNSIERSEMLTTVITDVLDDA
ncbi:MAG TPA: SEC-C domain-containing protein, partial [Acidimicrobiales bacterium]|nr:SEC-C domain-containing protein [Acidimicrobiales bacterium]